ncbi:phage tail protein [Vibrio sp. 10N.261.55.A7]|uniref:phage tail protein n=1 Tax=Vibrio sp. 10N.261.55.A7 TaxID=1880851 RepID=UPI000C84C6A6|nr:phage tail protein [Vibrio sp. 10N.261.55.A7]PMJ90295.1 phage tail protein [Vibrio sp. 10N.261.55.A7]
MSEPNDFISVQPDNRTLVEESLEYAWQQLLKQTANPYPDLKNPLLTPDEFVVLLAGERGVADWQPNDTLDQQRQTTDKAFEIHSKAGTRLGLNRALSTLGFLSEVARGSLPYSLDIEAEVEKGALTGDLQKRLSQRVTTYKSERDSISLDLVRSTTIARNVACFGETGVISDSPPFIFQDQERVVSMRVGILNEAYVYSDSRAAI